MHTRLALLRGILRQALEDAASKPAARLHAVEIDQARRWLTRRNRWFDEVCEFLDLDPDRARTKFKAYIAEFDRIGKRPALNIEEMAQEAPAARVDKGLIQSIRVREPSPPRRRVDKKPCAASAEEAAPRRPNATIIEYNGRAMSLRAWANHLGIARNTICNRFNAGLPLHDVFQNDRILHARGKLMVMYNGYHVTLAELSRMTGIKYSTIFNRYKRGLCIDLIVAGPSKSSADQA